MLLIIKKIADTIEVYPHSTSAFLTVIGFAGAMLGYVFYGRNMSREKRYVASIRFYPQLYMAINRLKQYLDDYNQLEVESPEKGNIYALIYTKQFCNSICPQYTRFDVEKEIGFINLTKQIFNLISESEVNVPPRHADRREWTKSQGVVLSFCNFVLESGERGIINKKTSSHDEDAIHTQKCKAFIGALNYLTTTIENNDTLL